MSSSLRKTRCQSKWKRGTKETSSWEDSEMIILTLTVMFDWQKTVKYLCCGVVSNLKPSLSTWAFTRMGRWQPVEKTLHVLHWLCGNELYFLFPDSVFQTTRTVCFYFPLLIVPLLLVFFPWIAQLEYCVYVCIYMHIY